MSQQDGPSLRRLHIAFALACFLMFAATLGVFVQDHYRREFPRYQDAYDNAELQRLDRERRALEEQLSAADVQAELATLREKTAAADRAAAASRDKLAAARQNLRAVDGRLDLAARQLAFAKADHDTCRYEVDARRRPARDLAARQQRVDASFAETEALKAEKEAGLRTIAELGARHTETAGALTRLLAAKEEAAQRASKAAGSRDLPVPALNLLRDAPGLDLFSPRRRIQQVVLPNLPVDVFFGKAQRVDRCGTCHQAIANPDPQYRAGASPEPHPVLRSHPRLELFVAPDSKHPYSAFGCTVCHQGRPMGVAFSRAAHSPRDRRQAEAWRRTYNWEPLAFWDRKMLPLQYTEAACLKCHRGLDEAPAAHTLNAGRELFRNRGCTNCHLGAQGDQDFAWVGRTGPDLRRMGEKLTLQWSLGWNLNPWAFRPSTRMPRFLGLENRRSESGETLKLQTSSGAVDRDAVEAEAISAYLFAASKLRERALPEPPASDAETGRTLFAAVGCVACHSTRDRPGAEKFALSAFAPDLSRIADKASPRWIFAWLKDPRRYWAETKMPDLRLSDAEAAALAAYLTQAMRSGVQPVMYQAFPEEAFDALILDKFSPALPRDRIAALLKDTPGLFEFAATRKDHVGLNALTAKVKYLAGPDGKLVDSGAGEWTEAQIAKLRDILATEPNRARAVKAFRAGEFLVQHYACYACHNIQGWTYAPLPCPNLQGEGDKDLATFAFGNTLSDGSLAYTRWDWIRTKISRPRVFDLGSLETATPFGRLRMPWFGHVAAHGQPTATADRGAQPGKYDPASNADACSPFSLTPEQIDQLVTHVLSLTLEQIPGEMRKTPAPQELALDRGRRVFRELNCAACHFAGVTRAPEQLPVESLVALLTPQARKDADDGIWVNEDLVSVDYAAKQAAGAEGEASALPGLLNIKRGTCLTNVTAPILMAEMPVRPDSLAPPAPAGFRLEKTKPPQPSGAWVRFGELLKAERFERLTVPVFYPSAETAAQAYACVKDWWADRDAYERIAGTAALVESGKLTLLQAEERRLARRYYEPAAVKVRLVKGEGAIVPHIVKLESERGVQNAGPQQAPPSLLFEGARVQPDWLYQHLRNIHTLRWGFTIRMPSYWSRPRAKALYPSGRLSALDLSVRDAGVAGEPLPAPEAWRTETLPDDAAEAVQYLARDAGEQPFGFQPLPVNAADTRRLYERGRQIVTGSELGCTNCHMFGQRKPPQPKWALDLANVKRRLKEPWLTRWLVNPQTIYPWTNMPNNFKLDWQGSIMGGDEARLKDAADRIRAVKHYLLHLGEGEIGEGEGNR